MDLLEPEEKEGLYRSGRALKAGLQISLCTLCSGTDAVVDVLKDCPQPFPYLGPVYKTIFPSYVGTLLPFPRFVETV